MASSPRSTFIPHPCTREEELHNWQALARLLSRVPLEPTADDDGKLLRWSNTWKRYILVSPCQAIVDCGGSGGECASPCSFASGITPATKTVSFAGSITPTGCAEANQILVDSPYTLICDGACRYTYLDVDFPCGVLAITLETYETEAIVAVGIGTLTGGAEWTLGGLVNPYDMTADIHGAYPLTSNTSTMFNALSMTAAVSA